MHKMKLYLLYVIFQVLLNTAIAAITSVNIQTCRQSDFDFNGCLVNAIEDALSKLKNGIPSLKIPPLEPLQVPRMVIGQGEGRVHVTQNFDDVNLLGATGTKIIMVDASKVKEYILYSETFTPSLNLQAKYDISGRVLLIPIVGKGKCVISLDGLMASHSIVGEKIQKKNEVYMKISNYTISLKPSKVTFYFENLFNGDQRLGNAMNSFLNEHWSTVFEDVKSGYEESLGIIFGHFTNKLFTQIPFNDIFPE